MRRSARAAALTGVLLTAVWLGGCATGGCPNSPTRGAGKPVGVTKAPPTFEAVAARYNARVNGLDKLKARTTVRFRGFDADGRPVEEQGEGNFQFVRARRLYLTVGKAGETGFQLGSDETRYWWIDAQRHIASVGTHAKATPDLADKSGIPVHPLDLIEVLGATTLERTPGITGPAWTEDSRRLRLSMPGRWGRRVLFLDPVTFEPVEIQLLDGVGRLAVRAELSEYTRVAGPGASAESARLAGRVIVSVPSSPSEVRVTFYDPEAGATIKDRSFKYESLAREYGVERVRDLDRAGAQGGAP